jgi:Pentapeptide repeats (8 copies)
LLYGANLAAANFQGTDMTGARPILADMRFADLQGTILAHARLEKAKLDGADLTGADVRNARLASADLSSARVTAADFRGAVVWATRPPEIDASGLVDASLLTARVPDQIDISSLRDIVEKIPLRRLKVRMSEGLSDMMAGRDAATWGASDEALVWARMQQASASASEGYGLRLTESLARFACRAQWANGAVAVGVARRAMAEGFRGDLPALYMRVRSTDCPASRAIAAPFLTEFGTAADIARGQ